MTCILSVCTFFLLFQVFHSFGVLADIEIVLHRIQVFLKGLCLKNGSHACIGGRYCLWGISDTDDRFSIKGMALINGFFRRRRNLLTLFEITRLYWAIIFYVHLESAVFLLMYKYQDRIGPDNVFFIIHNIYAVFDFSLLVCVSPN